LKASASVLLAFVVALKINLAETLAERLAQYEAFQLDEIPFLLLFIAIALAWFAWHRMVEQKMEIALRVVAEERNLQLLAENKSLTQHILKVQEFERLELARDLHDDIGQYLLAIRLDASALTVKGDDDNPARRILSNAGHIQNMAKSLMRRLRPAPTNSKNCVDGIHLMVQEWRELQPNVHIELHIDECTQLFSGQTDAQDRAISAQISVTLYRFVQEALTNIAKHAQAKHIDISLDLVNVAFNGNAQHLCLEIKDDGIALDVQAVSSGMGIIGMRERISAVNGEFLVRSNRPHGLIVCAKIPINMTRKDV
ncbi:MAG: histidine kinase, partial [Methylotenera sp.]|nr:histidine kinase [Methylotenera sp.]